VALITGAARGTGAVTAGVLAEHGARVVVTDVRDDLGHDVASALGDAGRYLHLDVSSEEEWASVVANVTGELGRIDVLVNNAAILHLAPIWNTSVDDYLRIVRVNELGTFLGVRSVVEPMRTGGGGSIINVSSIDAVYAAGTTVAYSASKFAVRGITKVAAVELGRYGIRVNCVCAAAGNPEMVRELLPPGFDPQAGGHQIPVGRRGEMGDVANVILFLASDESSFFTGEDFVLDGGLTAGQVVDAPDPP